MANGSNGGCLQCLTRDVCIASKLDRGRVEGLRDWFTEGRVLNSGDYLYRAGDVAQQQYHVRSGIFKTVVINACGDEFITGFHLPGDVLGIVHRESCYVDSAVALDAGSACELVTKKLEDNSAGDISAALIAHFAEQARDTLEHQISLSQSSAQARFAAFCLNYSEKLRRQNQCENILATPMSRTDLANYLGMTLESLSRVVSKLKATGVILATRDQIELVQTDTLKALALHTTL